MYRYRDQKFSSIVLVLVRKCRLSQYQQQDQASRTLGTGTYIVQVAMDEDADVFIMAKGSQPAQVSFTVGTHSLCLMS